MEVRALVLGVLRCPGEHLRSKFIGNNLGTFDRIVLAVVDPDVLQIIMNGARGWFIEALRVQMDRLQEILDFDGVSVILHVKDVVASNRRPIEIVSELLLLEAQILEAVRFRTQNQPIPAILAETLQLSDHSLVRQRFCSTSGTKDSRQNDQACHEFP